MRNNRICVLVILASWSLLSMGQSNGIDYDNTSDDGTRVFFAESENLYHSKPLIFRTNFCLGCAVNDSVCLYYLTLEISDQYNKEQVETGRKLLIKFDDDTFIELPNTKETDKADYTLQIFNGRKINYRKVSYTYLITEEQIKSICSKNVVKIRVEMDADYIDKKIKGSRFSKNMTKQWNSIQNALSL